jgi:hypothetical protein
MYQRTNEAMMRVQLVKNIEGVDHSVPSKLYGIIGHKKGVGKNSLE